jgi:hypothetical protein
MVDDRGSTKFGERFHGSKGNRRSSMANDRELTDLARCSIVQTKLSTADEGKGTMTCLSTSTSTCLATFVTTCHTTSVRVPCQHPHVMSRQNPRVMPRQHSFHINQVMINDWGSTKFVNKLVAREIRRWSIVNDQGSTIFVRKIGLLKETTDGCWLMIEVQRKQKASLVHQRNWLITDKVQINGLDCFDLGDRRWGLICVLGK